MKNIFIKMTNLKRVLLTALATGAIILTQVLLANPASAAILVSPANPASPQFGLGVSGAIVRADITPGTNYTHTMTISTTTSDSPMDIMVDVRGLGQTADGAVQALAPADDTSQYSARSFITLDTSSFHLDPGGSQKVVATINIPQEVGAGGRYAIIYIHNKPVGAGQVGIITAINVPLYLTVKDSQLIKTGKITGLPPTEAVPGEPINIVANFQNTGNIDYKVKAEDTITDSQGTVLDTITTPTTASAVVPTMTRALKATFTPQGTLALGTYSVQSKVMLDDGTVLDQASGTFEVKQPYVPPPAAASITVNPGSAATLTTSDGRISIAFPKGCVTGDTNVSIQSFSPSQLPSPQAGITLGTTCFQVQGITGLLLSNATMTVKYSSADLDKAGGDTSKLALGRWDEGQSTWTVLKTQLDTQAMTLTAGTNQFSIWAVVASGGPSATSAPTSTSTVSTGTTTTSAPAFTSTTPTGTTTTKGGVSIGVIIGIIVAVVVIAFVVSFFVFRRRSAHK